MQADKFNLVWIDLEMTGLDCSSDYIIEIATIVTDKNLKIIKEGPALAIYQPPEVLEQMDEWNKKHHTASGLLDEVKQSSIDAAEAEEQTLEFLEKYAFNPITRTHNLNKDELNKRGEEDDEEYALKPLMCGNTICQDRRFLARLMPDLEKFFHYRSLDVSTLKELMFRWAPNTAYHTDKISNHRALQDIRGSIEELKYYRKHFIRKYPEPVQTKKSETE